MHEFHHGHQILIFTLEVQKQKPINQSKFSTIAPEQQFLCFGGTVVGSRKAPVGSWRRTQPMVCGTHMGGSQHVPLALSCS